MERLTKRVECGYAFYPKCFDEPCEGVGCANPYCELPDLACAKLARYEEMEERIIKRIEEIKGSTNYPHNFMGQMVEDLEWVLSLLN